MSRYDGQTWTTFTQQDGLSSNDVFSIYQDGNGHLWFGTEGGGATRYDGQVFQTLTHMDGLADNNVNAILQDRDGYLWFSTFGGGITRFRPPSPSPPRIVIDAVVADRRYETPSEVPISSSADLTIVEFHGASFKTRLEAIIYQYRLNKENWTTTRELRAEYHDLPPGDHIFSVRAIDRDLAYSEPATVHLTIEPDPHILALTEALSLDATPGEFVGTSPALLKLQEELAEVAQTDLTVLIQGETGTGKGLAARAVHAFSNVSDGPFIQINCGGIPEGLIESELFGHERGAFTGAVGRKLGK